MIPWNHVPNSEISRLMEIHTFVDNNNNNKTIKRTQKYSFVKKKKKKHSQEWPLWLLNWWNSVHWGKNLMYDGAHRAMNWSVTMKQRQTSSKTTQCPALSACRNGPSRQAKAPPFPPSTGKSAPNKSVTSCRPKIAYFLKTLGQSVDKSKPVINCWSAIFRSRRP